MQKSRHALNLAGAMLCGGAALLAGNAASAGTINGADFTPGIAAQVLDGISWTSSPGLFVHKTLGVPTFTGVGITGGRTGDEIDIDETLAGTMAAVSVTSFRIGVLFDGPEYGDVNEIAQVTVNGSIIHTLTSTGTGSAIWSGPGFVTNLSPADAVGGAVWEVTSPFGATAVTSISFTAMPGVCGTAGGTCDNQSDFTLVQLVTGPVPVVGVPAPAAFALFGIGLLGLGLVARRRA